MREKTDSFDAVVVGAGPGGIAAAVALGEANLRVALVDDCPLAGGQIWRNRGGRSLPPQAVQWFARLSNCSAVTRFQQSRIVARIAPGTLLAETPAGPRQLVSQSVVLATGARELFIPFPGWTLPGVYGAGAIQALIKAGMPVDGKRVVVAGSGPLLLAVADLLRAKGASVPVVIEQAPSGRVVRFGLSLIRTPSKLGQAMFLRARTWRTRYATDSYPLRVEQLESGLRLTYRCGGKEQSIVCDLLACGFNLIPNTELAMALGCELTSAGFVSVNDEARTSAASVYAVGELTGVGGVDKAIIEGQLAARSILKQDARPLKPVLASAREFAGRLDLAFALRSDLFKLATPDTIVCRCEDVTYDAVSRCVNARDAKLQTRCGMGPCQSRICGPTMSKLFGAEASQSRPPLMAATVRSLAGQSNPTQDRATIFKEIHLDGAT